MLFRSVSGVGLVSLSGGQRPAVRIQADTQSLAAYGIGLDTLRGAITVANSNSAKGSFDGPKRAYTINANDQLLTAADYKRLIVATRTPRRCASPMWRKWWTARKTPNSAPGQGLTAPRSLRARPPRGATA